MGGSIATSVKQLEHVVLHHVAQGPGPIVIFAAALDTDSLGDRDLDMVDVGAVPERLEHRVREAQRQQVLDSLLAEIVIDAENAFFGERQQQRRR